MTDAMESLAQMPFLRLLGVTMEHCAAGRCTKGINAAGQ